MKLRLHAVTVLLAIWCIVSVLAALRPGGSLIPIAVIGMGMVVKEAAQSAVRRP